LSSHLMSEMALTADHVIVLGRGRLLRDEPMAALIASASPNIVRVRSPQARQLAGLLMADAVTVNNLDEHTLEVDGYDIEHIGGVASAAGITLFELTAQVASLEEAYMELTADSVEYRSTDEYDAHSNLLGKAAA